VIELFARLTADGNIESLYEQGRRLAGQRRWDGAIELLATALLLTHSREESYAPVCALLRDAFAASGDARSALSLSWYAADRDHQRELFAHVPPIDRARTLAQWAAAAPPARKAELYAQAARELEEAGLLARAAIFYERADDVNAARALWSRLAQLLDSQRADMYAAGLARFNLARMNGVAGDARAAREATVAAVHSLEEAADRFESMGQRERAFDCYHVLIAIGELSRTFEHVLEGSVNAIRILSEDNLRYHALRLYEHAIRLAERAGESSAAATIAREMADYARKQGLGRIALRGVLLQAKLWHTVAEQTIERGGPAQLAENAYVASLLASAEAGQYARVGAIYRQLGELGLHPARSQAYARSARRYAGASDGALDRGQLEQRLGEHVPPPDVWHVDLIEWEERGNAAEACADVLLDPDEESDRITRRSALVGRLVALAAERTPAARSARAAVVVADYLAPIGLYGLLAPLEASFARPEPEVRQAAIRALSRYFYKRTFVTLEQALRDSDRSVVQEATAALERLRFDHAFDPLARIYRTAPRPEARLAALKAIARIDVVEAAELLLGALEHGGPGERETAIAALKLARGGRFVETARAALPQASEQLKRSLAEILRSRGISV
jgi:tetratricopeptide (TPR) repeat protein